MHASELLGWREIEHGRSLVAELGSLKRGGHKAGAPIAWSARRIILPIGAAVAALCLLGEFRFSDTLGFALTVAIVLWQWRQRPRRAVAAA